jgi:Type IX secretion system protein PorV
MISLKKSLLSLSILGLIANVSAQNRDIAITTGAVFQRIAPDARASGLGDQGVATSPDTYSQYWNTAKYAFAPQTAGLGISYVPWMSKITSDVFVMNLVGHSYLDSEERSALSGSLYYFNMGEVQLSSLVGNEITNVGKVTPLEFALDLGYSLKLADSYAMAVTGRYINSNFGTFAQDNQKMVASTFAIDISGFYNGKKHQSFGETEGALRAGFNLKNIGPKLDYSGNDTSRTNLPTALLLGAGYDINVDKENKFALTGEVSKLLVPSVEEIINSAGKPQFVNPNKDLGVVGAMGKSFSQGNFGARLMKSVSLEYSYDESFFLRTGYFHESETQGARQFATAGLGFRYTNFGLDVSYLINTSKINSALDNTLKFSLAWNFGGKNKNND